MCNKRSCDCWRSYQGSIEQCWPRRESQRRYAVSDKIKSHHVERKAILYVRQSSVYQVQNNLESQKLQYAMRDRLCSLGWRDIEVIDEDLGRSASGALTRAGFERMVAEVCLGHVGAVAAREVSRFARNSREWQKLVEVCRVVDTLLIDQEMVYSPRQSTDRLLLGLNRPETQSTSLFNLLLDHQPRECEAVLNWSAASGHPIRPSGKYIRHAES